MDPAAIIETFPEIIETLPEATEAITQVIEVVETIDYTPLLNEILTAMQTHTSLLGYLAGFSLFAVVAALCYFCYKFFRIFF